MNSLQVTEAECAAGRTAPRVSLADIEASISSVNYARGDVAAGVPAVAPGAPELSLSVLTLAFVTLKNGFVVVGKAAPASPANFDAELGKKLAYEDAVRQIWPLMGFALRERIASKAA